MERKKVMEKDLEYWKQNAEEDYITTPISVLRYITELEQKHEHRCNELKDKVKTIHNYLNLINHLKSKWLPSKIELLQQVLFHLLSNNEGMSLTEKEDIAEKIKQLSDDYKPT